SGASAARASGCRSSAPRRRRPPGSKPISPRSAPGPAWTSRTSAPTRTPPPAVLCRRPPGTLDRYWSDTMRRLIAIPALLAAGVLLVGCAPASPGVPGTSPLVGTWVGEQPRVGEVPTLILDANGGLGGTDGCNVL